MKLDKEEKGIVEAYENGLMDLIEPSAEKQAEYKRTAENTFRKDRRITIRLYDHDLKRIQKKAMEKGIPYQTLISSMIHQYVEGDLIETQLR
ncbi:MAG: hypothetical protein WC340_15045 [Kiritimatiellia bacterium]